MRQHQRVLLAQRLTFFRRLHEAGFPMPPYNSVVLPGHPDGDRSSYDQINGYLQSLDGLPKAYQNFHHLLRADSTQIHAQVSLMEQSKAEEARVLCMMIHSYEQALYASPKVEKRVVQLFGPEEGPSWEEA